jgi:hypothetical protein
LKVYQRFLRLPIQLCLFLNPLRIDRFRIFICFFVFLRYSLLQATLILELFGSIKKSEAMSRLMSEKWNGEPTTFPKFMVDLQAELQKDGSTSAIIQEGERGYLEEIVDDELPGDQQIAPDGIMRPTPASVFQIHKSDCRKNKKDRQDQEDMCGRAFAIILSMVNEDVIRKIRHIRDDKDYRNKDKAEYVIAQMMNSFVGNTAAVRTKLKARIEALEDIDTEAAALIAIDTIEDVNKQLSEQANPAGQVNIYQMTDADKIEKFLDLLHGEKGRLFDTLKERLIEWRDEGHLTWRRLSTEVQRVCDNLKAEEAKSNVKTDKARRIAQVSMGKMFEEDRKATYSDRGDARDRSQDRYRSRDRSIDRGNGRENYRSGRQDGFDRNYDGRRQASNGSSSYDRRSESRERGSNDRGRDDRRQNDSQGSFRRGEFSRREDSPFRPQHQASGSRYRDEPSRDGRDRSRGRSSSPAHREGENERFDRRIAAYMKQLSQGAKSPGKSRE